jgi:hypothetical protein
LVFLVAFFPLAFLAINFTQSYSPLFALHVPPIYPSRLNNPNYTWRKYQSRSSSCSLLSYQFIPLRSNYWNYWLLFHKSRIVVWVLNSLKGPFLSQRILCTTVNPLFSIVVQCGDHLCSLLVRVSGCRPKRPGIDPRRYQISEWQWSHVRFSAASDFWVAVSLERDPISLVSINVELLEKKIPAPI